MLWPPASSDVTATGLCVFWGPHFEKKNWRDSRKMGEIANRKD